MRQIQDGRSASSGDGAGTQMGASAGCWGPVGPD